jgi:ubiquinone/menaquinone biosynthesis C-methylase UbiE
MSLDTLEHVADYRAALAEFHRVLSPGGVLFLHVPAYFFDRDSSAPIDPENDPWEHVRYFSGRELVESIRETGLVVLRAQLHLDYGAMLCVAGKSA